MRPGHRRLRHASVRPNQLIPLTLGELTCPEHLPQRSHFCCSPVAPATHAMLITRPERAISADIDASHFRGATNTFPGLSSHDEPIGAYSWQLD